ncbi:PREDICTED: proclotting enzyme-like isoform X2 [Vollenhovia emeryi]|uniref:proclotting enzyme-like isoform X2 n=1 Tax=Vollenhovia emeryi TaxID=411798 RepID=UPI0005F582E0|nr:PREDICTED: proclotting enzyme-like isoform X2 [Vollenhovia emeryi]
MPKISIFVTLLFFIMVYSGTPPCSEYYTYSINSTTKSILGQIAIPPPPENDEFYLKVVLETNADLRNGMFRLELLRSIKNSIQAIQQGRPLLYRVNFPTGENFPIVSAIWFNNHQYCLDSKASSGKVNTIMLGHIVYPPSEESISKYFQPWYRNSSSYQLYNPVNNNPRNISSNSTINEECGVTSYYTDRTNNLVPNCEYSSPGQWPWVAAIYILKSEGTTKFRCSGTFISTKHIITVESYKTLKRLGYDTMEVPDNMYAVFGQFNSRQWHGTGTFNRQIIDYVYKTVYITKFSTRKVRDKYYLAIFTVESPIEYSPLIKPICLYEWGGNDSFVDIVYQTGYIVGFDRNVFEEQNIIEEPRMARVTLLDKNRFCVQMQNVGRSCYVDTGSGLVLSVDGRYLLRGIVLKKLITSSSSPVYVTIDVAKHLYWIVNSTILQRIDFKFVSAWYNSHQSTIALR